MKSSLLALLFFVVFSQGIQAQVTTEGDVVEIPIQGVFAPKSGFDDNDNIQLVVDGVLPNACYKKGQTLTSVDVQTQTVTVKQYAHQNVSGDCSDITKLPEELRIPVPFMSESDIGKLNVGQYNIQFDSLTGPAKRALNVERAKTASVDNLYYAITTHVYTPSEISVNEPEIKIMISGYLNSSCTALERTDVLIIEDSIVLLPQVRKVSNYCMPVAKDFVREVLVKNPGAGRYQVHIRSVNGSAVNRLFTIK